MPTRQTTSKRIFNATAMESDMAGPGKKLNIELSYDPAISLLGNHP